MDKALHESILEITLDADDLYVSDLNPSSVVACIGEKFTILFWSNTPRNATTRGPN